MIAAHNISNVSFGRDTISLSIDGKKIEIALELISQKLQNATDLQRNLFIISPSGYGIHWPLIDEDLAVDAILNLSNKNHGKG